MRYSSSQIRLWWRVIGNRSCSPLILKDSPADLDMEDRRRRGIRDTILLIHRRRRRIRDCILLIRRWRRRKRGCLRRREAAADQSVASGGGNEEHGGGEDGDDHPQLLVALLVDGGGPCIVVEGLGGRRRGDGHCDSSCESGMGPPRRNL